MSTEEITTPTTNANVINLALQYVDDSVLRSQFLSPAYTDMRQTTPKPNRSFLTPPEEAWEIFFDARTLGPDPTPQQGFMSDWTAIGWKPVQLIVEIGRRGDVLSVERHYQAAPAHSRQLVVINQEAAVTN